MSKSYSDLSITDLKSLLDFSREQLDKYTYLTPDELEEVQDEINHYSHCVMDIESQLDDRLNKLRNNKNHNFER